MCGALVGPVCSTVTNCNIILRGNVFNRYLDRHMRSARTDSMNIRLFKPFQMLRQISAVPGNVWAEIE